MTIEAELNKAREEFFIVCIQTNNISVMKRAYENYAKISDKFYMPKIKEINKRLEKYK